MRAWGIAAAIAFVLVATALPGPAGTPATTGIGPTGETVIRVDSGTSVTIWEQTTDVNVLTYSVPTLMGAGGTFVSLAAERYTFTSDGIYLKIHCFRDAYSSPSGVGHNVGGARLDGVPGYPNGLWASAIVSYIVGYNGNASTRFRVLGSDLSSYTLMGDQHSELVLAFTVSQANRAPVIASFTASPAGEGSPVTFTANASDPDGDPLTYSFDVDGDGAWDATGPSPTATRVFGDDRSGTATVRVSDGNLTATATTPVDVSNVPPAVDGVRMAAVANLTLRVAGEKWHDVVLEVVGPNGVVANASVTRHPGSPDDQRATVHGGPFDLLGANLSVVVRYTPWDDPVNGQPNGANPVWVILTAQDGTEAWVHHTFNVRHPETWNWSVAEVRAFAIGLPLRFEATARDPGSDDLTFAWSWGDGTADAVTTYYNDGIGPDPHPSPQVNPMTVTDRQGHAFATAGVWTVTLTVTDDDGGTTVAVVSVAL